MKRSFINVLKILLFIVGFGAAVWYFLPWSEIGKFAMSTASGQLSSRGMRIGWSDVSGETDGFTASMHAKAIINHAGRGIIDYMIVNDTPISEEMRDYYAKEGAEPVAVDGEAINALGVGFVKAGIINESDVIRHDPARLSNAVMRLIYQMTGR